MSAQEADNSDDPTEELPTLETADEDGTAFSFLNESATERPLAPTYRLFSFGAIVCAAMLGGVPAGATVLAVNFLRIRRYLAAFVVVAVAIALMVVFVEFGAKGIGGGYGVGILLAFALADGLQGKLLDDHLRHRGTLLKYHWGLAVGMLWLAVFAGIVLTRNR